MKKPLYIFSLLILLIVAFVAGNRFNQRGAGQSTASKGERQILHYVDPMDPKHITKEPGIAPCGMPMEPVYADDDTIGGSGAAGLSTSPGLVRVNQQKQQIIGVRSGEVTKSAETFTIRALGRIAADENRIYPLIAATDGWVGEIKENTTGSLVKADQLMAQIKVYNYEFFTWRTRYLAELGQIKHMGGASPPLTRRELARLKYPPPQTGLASPASEMQTTRPSSAIPQGHATEMASQNTESPSPPASAVIPSSPPLETPQAPDRTEERAASPMPDSGTPPENAQPGAQHHAGTSTGVMEKRSLKPGADHSEHMENMVEQGNMAELNASRENNPQPYAPYRTGTTSAETNRGRRELLNLGVVESQLQEVMEGRNSLTHIELRSPVSGYVLSRSVSPMQKIESGTECFKIADLSTVWVEADLYDSEAKYIRPGTQARVSMPGQKTHLAATVSDVLPRYDAASRSLKVRLEMDNPGNVFRPDMFVDVEFLVAMPESIAVPSGALIDSGKSKVVYVVIEEGVFEPREVVTGWRFNDRVEIAEGLKPGEKIVVSGNFLIDSESRMKLAAARLMEEKTEKPPGAQVPVGAAAPEPPTTMPAMQKAAAAEKPKDPICGMKVDPETARTAGLFAEVQGKTYYFCSEECKVEFHRHGPQPDAAATADQGPAAPSGHGMPAAPTQHAMPADAPTMEDSRHSPEKEKQTNASGAQPSMPTAPAEPQAGPHAGTAEPVGQVIKDPICAMSVDPENARSAGLFAEVQGQTYYFCSEECKVEFELNGPQPAAADDQGPAAPSGHGMPAADPPHAMPPAAATAPEPQHSPVKQTPAEPPGTGEHDHD